MPKSLTLRNPNTGEKARITGLWDPHEQILTVPHKNWCAALRRLDLDQDDAAPAPWRYAGMARDGYVGYTRIERYIVYLKYERSHQP